MTGRTLAAIGLAVLALVAICALTVSTLTSTVDGFLLDEDAARFERLRLVDAEQQSQETQEAQARAEEAQRQVEIERERAAQEEAKERQREYEVEWQRAYGERVRDEAAAYTTRRMADASYKAIQRQGHLLALSHLQYTFFGGVLMAGLIFCGLGVLIWYGDKQRQNKRLGVEEVLDETLQRRLQ